MTTVPHPLFISTRLMAAYAIPRVGTLHLSAERRDAERRIVYRYVIEDDEGTELDSGDDLRSGVGAEPDYLYTMRSLLGFLYHAGTSRSSDYGFTRAAVEWARHNSDELATAESEIDTDPGNHHEQCAECVAGNTGPHLQRF